MAATRLIALHVNKGKTVAQCLADRTNYSENKEKTNNGEFISSYCCDPKTCDEEFFLAKREYQQKTGRTNKRDVIAYQIRQSFKPGEITLEEANKIGYELAMRFTKGKHAYIVATHIDKAHIHNHIIFNSTTLDCERKFKNFMFSGRAVQKVSDMICIENGLSVIEPRPYREREKYDNTKFTLSLRDRIRQDIDDTLKQKPKNMDELLSLLMTLGYEVKRGKNIAVRLPGSKRFLRLNSMGDGYTESSLIDVLSGKANHEPKPKRVYQSEFTTVLDMQKIIAQHKGVGYNRWASNFNLKQISKSLLFMQEKGIPNIEKLNEIADNFSAQFDNISKSIKAKEMRLAEIVELRKQIINYSKTRDVYVDYRKAGYSKKFFEEHREDILVHKAAKEAFNRLGLKKIPKIKELNEKYASLISEKRKEYANYKTVKTEMQDYVIARRNLEELLKHEQPQKKREQTITERK